jgi:serine/threonine protein kinase
MKKVHGVGILHRDLNPHNFLLLNGNLLLADFGGNKDEQSIADGNKQTGVFTMFWADVKARAGQYSMASEVYAFGVCAHFLIWGQPLFGDHNKQAYLDNTKKSKNFKNDASLLQGIINWCLSDEMDRPTFEMLEKEVFYHYLGALLTAEEDDKALALIRDYATLPILSHQERVNEWTCLIRACFWGRLLVVKAIVEWRDDKGEGVDLNAKTKGETALDWAVIKDKPDIAAYLHSKGGACNKKTYSP